MLMKLVNNITLWWGLLTGNIIPTNNIWNILLTGGEKLCLELCGFSHSYFIIYQSPGFLHTQTPASQTLLHQCSAQRIRKQKCNLMDNSGLHWFPILVSAGLWSHLFILLVCEVVGDFVPQPHHVLDGRLPDSPGSLAVGVKAAVRDLTSSPPPAPEAAPFVPIELRALEENSGAVVEHEHPAPPGVVRLPGVLQTDGAPVGAVDRSVAAAVRHLAPLQDGRAAPPGPEAAVPGVVEGGLLHLQLRPLVHHDTPGLQARGGDIAPSDRPPPALAVERGWDSGSEVWGVRCEVTSLSLSENTTSPGWVGGQVSGGGARHQDTVRDLEPLTVLQVETFPVAGVLRGEDGEVPQSHLALWYQGWQGSTTIFPPARCTESQRKTFSPISEFPSISIKLLNRLRRPFFVCLNMNIRRN